MENMKAVRIHEYGGPEVMVYEDVPRPIPGPGQVLVRTGATSINPFDYFVRAGYTASFLPLPLPIILGRDVAGVIEEVGPDVSGFQVGDPVYGSSGYIGSYAEYVAVSASDLARAPRKVDVVHAAVVPNVALAAWHALFELADLRAGQTVLVHAAAGGVGHIAVQLAKWRGATVIGTASRNSEFLEDLNIDRIIDYTTTAFEDAVSDVDVVVDSVGGDTYERSPKVLKPGGVLVSTVRPMEGGPSEEIAATYDCEQKMVISRPPIASTLTEVAALIDAQYIKPYVSAVFPLSEAGKAHEMIQGGHTRGKIALQVM